MNTGLVLFFAKHITILPLTFRAHLSALHSVFAILMWVTNFLQHSCIRGEAVMICNKLEQE